MRSSVYNIPVQFRISQQQLTAARQKAEQVGVTFSELVRSALRHEVEALGIAPAPITVQCPPPLLPVAVNGALGLEVAAIVKKAASGDLECQRALFRDRQAALAGAQDATVGALVAATELVSLGRLMASHGNQGDIRQFAAALINASTVLSQMGCADTGDYLMAEAISILEQLAECGDDLAAVCSADLIGMRPVEFADRVRRLRSRAVSEETV